MAGIDLRGPSGNAAYLSSAQRPGGLTALADAIANGEDCSLAVLTDSTGVGTTRWPYLVGQYLAAQNPNYTVQVKNWNDTNQAYDAATVIQTGTAGAPRYVTLDGSGSVMSPDGSLAAPPSGDIDVRVKCRGDWTPNTLKIVAAHWGGGQAGTRSWYFTAKQTSLVFAWSQDGTTQAFSQQSTASPSYPSASTWVWLRATLQVNVAGQWVLKFYQSADYDPEAQTGTWTQVGATWTNNSGPSSIAAAANWPYELGASQGTASPFTGDVAYLEVRDGVNGPIMANNVAGLFSSYAHAGTRNGAPVLTILNGAKAGADLTYLTNSTRLPKMLPYGYGVRAIIVASSHNDTYLRGSIVTPTWDSWLAAIRALHPLAGVVPMTENPRISPADYIQAHEARRRDLLLWAHKNGLDCLDIFRAFNESGLALSTLVQSDGIHPTDGSSTPVGTGSALWAQTIETALSARA